MPSGAATSNVAPFPASGTKPRPGLVLTGGGARAAYQVGVLKAVRDILGNPVANPFPIVCGTSAGAGNAAALPGVGDHIYRTDAASIMKSGARWFATMMLISRNNPVSLLDNAPLREMLEKTLAFERIQGHIDSGALYAGWVTASGYTSGPSVAFFQGGSG